MPAELLVVIIERVIAMLGEADVAVFRELRRAHRDNAAVQRAAAIAAEVFSAPTARAVIRMREHELFTAEMQIERMLELLRHLLHDDD